MCGGCRVCRGISCAYSVCSRCLLLFSARITVSAVCPRHLYRHHQSPLLFFCPSLPSSSVISPLNNQLTINLTKAASQISQQMLGQQASPNPSANVNPFGPGQDPNKLFLAEAENLEVMEHYSILDGVEERVLRRLSSR